MSARSRTRQLRAMWIVIGAMVAAGAITLSAWRPLQLVRALIGVARNPVTAADLDPSARREIVLVVGIDDRSALDERGAFGAFRGAHADVIVLAAIRRGGVTAVSVPRDTRAQIAGYGAQRIGAFRNYGAQALVRAVRSVVDVPITHYVEIDMAGAAAVVDAVGGVDVRLRHDARDAVTGFAAPAGDVRLDGRRALAFARSREYRVRRDGTWVEAGGGDRQRIRRQHLVARALRTRMAATGWADMRDIVLAGDGHVSVDATMDLQDAVQLVRAFRAPRWDVTTLRTRRAVTRDESLSPFPPLRWGAGATLEPTPGAVDAAIGQLQAHEDVAA